MKQSKATYTWNFLKWPFEEDFSAETDEQGYIMSLGGKVCWLHIRNEVRLRRLNNGSVNVDNYADNVASIHLTVVALCNQSQTCNFSKINLS